MTEPVVIIVTKKPSSILGRPSTLHKISLTIIGSLERFFYNWGFSIANHPWLYIISCLVLTVICSVGLIRFTPENRPDKLWIPWNSDFVKDSDWLRENFPSPIRFHHAIITADNVLEPEVMQMLLDIHYKVEDLKTGVFRWNDVCFKLPVTKFAKRRRKRQIRNATTTTASFFDKNTFSDFSFEFDDDTEMTNGVENIPEDPDIFDPSISLSSDVYCEILASLDEECWESNIVELWNYDKERVQRLNKNEILNAVNSKQISPVFGRPVDYSTELGAITRNESSHIIKAEAIMIRWFGKINQTALNQGEIENDLGTGENVDKISLLWEKELSDLLISYPLPQGVSLYFNVARSFGDVSGVTIMGDAGMLVVGFVIVFIYVIFMLGQFNMVEQRPMLSLAGLSCVGLSIGVSYGVCSAFRIIYGPIHNVLPFLLLGIGIDDMFVIMQCWNNLSPESRKKTLPERMGLTLQHAGVSITVTSVTDFFAFAIGATTVLPALQSFCIYAALGVFATYIFQATFFVAWLVLDQRRIESRRNAFILCYTHKEFSPKNCSQKSFSQLFFQKIYCKFLFQKITKVLVFLVTFGLLGVNVWGNMKLRQEFNPIWFLPQDSYLFKYFAARDQYFPERGEDAFVLMNNVSLSSNLLEIDTLVSRLKASPHIHEIDAWYSDFKTYVNRNFVNQLPNEALTETNFNKYMGRFLFSPLGSKYRGRLKLSGNLTCGIPSPPILVSNIGFKFKVFNRSEEQIPAMNEIKELVKNANFSSSGMSRSFVWSFVFAGWETDEIITAELYRNMALAMICVLFTTLILIANFQTCLMVLVCVIFTLVNVGGSMHFWNLTIDTVSCIDLVIAIGLCVDYAAHIGHAFMTCAGTRDQRAKHALTSIGPAVLNGGFSTFLAFLLLANSKSHVFTTFFKIFFLVVVYGLFHGLVFLPVLLSVLGPDPYDSALEILDDPHSEQNMPLKSLPISSSFIEVKNGVLLSQTSGRSNFEDEDEDA